MGVVLFAGEELVPGEVNGDVLVGVVDAEAGSCGGPVAFVDGELEALGAMFMDCFAVGGGGLDAEEGL